MRARDIDARLRRAFRNIDVNRSGDIDEDELKAFFQLVELGLSDEEVAQALASVDQNRNGVVDEDEFEIVSFVVPIVTRKRATDKYRAAFNLLKSHRNVVGADELRKASRMFGIRSTKCRWLGGRRDHRCRYLFNDDCGYCVREAPSRHCGGSDSTRGVLFRHVRASEK